MEAKEVIATTGLSRQACIYKRRSGGLVHEGLSQKLSNIVSCAQIPILTYSNSRSFSMNHVSVVPSLVVSLRNIPSLSNASVRSRLFLEVTITRLFEPSYCMFAANYTASPPTSVLINPVESVLIA